MKNLIFIFLFISLIPFIGESQSGWVKAPGEWYGQLSAAKMQSKDYFNLLGTRTPTNQFEQKAINLYAEYGLNKKLTLISGTSFRSNAYETTNSVTALSDFRVEVKYSLLQKKYPLAISVSSEIPLSNKTNFATANEPNGLGIREKINLATTDGEVNFWTTLALSHSFGKGKMYASAYSAYNLRTSGFTDQIKTGVEFGIQPFNRFWLNGKLNSLFSASATPNPGVPFIRGEGTTFTAHSFGASYTFKNNLGILAEYFAFSDLISQRKNIYSAPVFSIGLFIKHAK